MNVFIDVLEWSSISSRFLRMASMTQSLQIRFIKFCSTKRNRNDVVTLGSFLKRSIRRNFSTTFLTRISISLENLLSDDGPKFNVFVIESAFTFSRTIELLSSFEFLTALYTLAFIVVAILPNFIILD